MPEGADRYQCWFILTHWGREEINAVLQKTFLSAFSWLKMYESRLRFHWSLFLRVQLTLVTVKTGILGWARSIQSDAVMTRSNITPYCTIRISELKLFEPTKDIPYLALMGKLWVVLLYPPYPKDRGMLWFYVKAARRPPPAARRPPPAARRPQWC